MKCISYSIPIALLLFLLASCGRDEDASAVEKLTVDQLKYFPKDYYTLDTLYMVYGNSLNRDSFLLRGKPIEKYVKKITHRTGEAYGTAYHEAIRKSYINADGHQFLSIEASTSQSDDLYNGYAGFLIQIPGADRTIMFGELKDSTADQVIHPKHPDDVTPIMIDTVVYNRITGIRHLYFHAYKKILNVTFHR